MSGQYQQLLLPIDVFTRWETHRQACYPRWWSSPKISTRGGYCRASIEEDWIAKPRTWDVVLCRWKYVDDEQLGYRFTQRILLTATDRNQAASKAEELERLLLCHAERSQS